MTAATPQSARRSGAVTERANEILTLAQGSDTLTYGDIAEHLCCSPRQARFAVSALEKAKRVVKELRYDADGATLGFRLQAPAGAFEAPVKPAPSHRKASGLPQVAARMDAIALMIVENAGPDGWLRRSRKDLAAALGCSPGQAQRAVAKLVREGRIDRHYDMDRTDDPYGGGILGYALRVRRRRAGV